MKADRIAAVVCCAASAAFAQPLDTSFTYQGVLADAGAPVTGTYDLRFRLYDSLAGSGQVGAALCANDVAVTDGRFTAALDFGAGAFAGQKRFLEIEVRSDTGLACADASGYTLLTPRQELTAAPHASFSLQAINATSAANAVFAANAGSLNGQAPAFYTNAGNLTAGTLPDARLSTNVARLNASQTFAGAVAFTNAGSSFTGNGSGLTALSAANVASGLLADARLSSNIPRLNAASNNFTGNLGVNTAPTERLDVSGIGRFSQGVRFGDQTLQTTAALDPGDLGFTSGYPAGTTVAITVNGTTFPTARLLDGFRLTRPLSAGIPAGQLQWTQRPTLRRPRTADNTWYDWVRNGTALSGLVVTLTVPSGGTMTYTLPSGNAFSYRVITADDNLPFEEIQYACGNLSNGLSTNPAVAAGSIVGVTPPTVRPRLGDTTGSTGLYRLVVNNVIDHTTSVVGDPVFAAAIDPTTGNRAGALASGTFLVRANAGSAAQNVDGWVLTNAARNVRLIIDTVTDINVINNAPAGTVSWGVRVADDGFPVEEAEFIVPLN